MTKELLFKEEYYNIVGAASRSTKKKVSGASKTGQRFSKTGIRLDFGS